jgi:Tfp pilus assembly protein PilF
MMKHIILLFLTTFISVTHANEMEFLLARAKNPPQDPKARLDLANELLKTGNVFFNSWEPEKALQCFSAMLNISPNFSESYHNTGLCLAVRYGNHTDAIAAYDKALEIKPDHVETHFCKSLSHLALGDFKTGFAEHEWRWKGPEHPRQRHLPYPLPKQWQGEDVSGKRILVRAEQGLGDVIQFSRYIQILKEDGAYIIFEAPPPLYKLFSHVTWIDEFMPVDAEPPAFDYQITLMSMPYVFNTRVHTVPQNIPYLHADPQLVEQWKSHFDKRTFNIGICWYGDPVSGPLKFMPLDHLAQLSKFPYVKLYSLQKVDGTEQLKDLPADMVVHTFGDDFDTKNGRFMDTAAVMMNLDLIITVDTSIAHLAGALGRPTWVLLPQVAEWRWMVGRSDTPWYPTMQLFRQTEIKKWDDVLEQLKKALLPLVINTMQKSSVVSEVSVGELIDKITILRIKDERIKSEEKLINIRAELHSLETIQRAFVATSPMLDDLTSQLIAVNKILWDIEDDIREKEHSKTFDEEFVQLARNVYLTNDQRCAIKRTINEMCGSRLKEEKSYTQYTA